MGNLCGRSQVVHPVGDEDGAPQFGPEGVRIKVRMSVRKLAELRSQVDLSKGQGRSELASLIIQECLQGRLRGRVIVAGELSSPSTGGRRESNLCTIGEGDILSL